MAQYYPLSLHLFAAYVVRFGTVSIPTALFGATTLVVAIAWPVGMYCLTKVAVAWRWAPVIAAAFASTALQFPYKPISWSGLTTLAGLSLVPVVVTITLVMFHDLDTTAVPAVGFSLGALFVLHNPQALAAAVLALTRSDALPVATRTSQILVGESRPDIPRRILGADDHNTPTPCRRRSRTQRPNRDLFRRDRGACRPATHAFSELASVNDPSPRVRTGRNGRRICDEVRSFSGLCLRRDCWSRHSSWLGSVVDRPFPFVVSPWYGHAERVAYNLVIPVSILGAIAICGGRQLLASQLAKVQSVRFRRVLSASVVAATIGVVVVTSLGSAKNLNAASKQDIAYFQVLDRSILDEAQSLADEAGRPIRIFASSAWGNVVVRARPSTRDARVVHRWW